MFNYTTSLQIFPPLRLYSQHSIDSHIFKCRVTFLDRRSHCIKYVVQRHKAGTIVIGCTYFSFCRNALFQRILRLVFIFQRISEQRKTSKQCRYNTRQGLYCRKNYCKNNNSFTQGFCISVFFKINSRFYKINNICRQVNY